MWLRKKLRNVCEEYACLGCGIEAKQIEGGGSNHKIGVLVVKGSMSREEKPMSFIISWTIWANGQNRGGW